MDANSGRDLSSSASTSPKCNSVRSTSSAFSANALPDEDWTKISDLAERRRIQNRIAQRNYRRKLKKKLEDLKQRCQSNSVSPEPMHEDFVVQDPRSDQRKQSHTLRVPQPNTNSGRQLSPDVSQSQYAYQHESLTTAPHQQPHYYSSWPPREYLTDPPSSQHHNAHMMSTCPSTASDASMYQYMTALSLPTSHPSMAFPEKDDCYAEGDSNHFGLSFERPSTTDSMYLQPYQGHDAQTPALSISDSFDAFSAEAPSSSCTSYPRTPASMPGSPLIDLYGYSYD